MYVVILWWGTWNITIQCSKQRLYCLYIIKTKTSKSIRTKYSEGSEDSEVCNTVYEFLYWHWKSKSEAVHVQTKAPSLSHNALHGLVSRKNWKAPAITQCRPSEDQEGRYHCPKLLHISSGHYLLGIRGLELPLGRVKYAQFVECLVLRIKSLGWY
jgi:hypothetical protein